MKIFAKAGQDGVLTGDFETFYSQLLFCLILYILNKVFIAWTRKIQII